MQPARRTALRVVVKKDGELVDTLMFNERRVTVGRTDQALLKLDSPSVSRQHAVIEHDGSTIRIKDTDSANGIFVGGQRMASAIVGEFDDIRVGAFSLACKLVAPVSHDQEVTQEHIVIPGWAEDEDPETFRRADFSMLALFSKPQKTPPGAKRCVEMITAVGDSIVAAAILRPGDDSPWVHVASDGTCTVTPPYGARPSAEDVALTPGGRVIFSFAAYSYHIRFIDLPTLQRGKGVLRDGVLWLAFVVSGLIHASAVALGLFSPLGVPPVNEETYVEITLAEIHSAQEADASDAPLVQQAEPLPLPELAAPQAPSKRRLAKERARAYTPPVNVAPPPPAVPAAPARTSLLGSRSDILAPGVAAALSAFRARASQEAQTPKAATAVAMPPAQTPAGIDGDASRTDTALLRGDSTRKVTGIVQKAPQNIQTRGGGIDRFALQKVVNENISQIRRCYRDELTRNPRLSGRIEVEWTLAADGSVKNARQRFASFNSKSLSQCILAHALGWRFPPPTGGEVVITYPFVLNAEL